MDNRSERESDNTQNGQPRDTSRPVRSSNLRTRSKTPNRSAALQRNRPKFNDQPKSVSNLTYAQAVRSTGDAHKNVRNIHFPDGNEAVRKELLASNICKEIDITSIKNKGKNLISVRCANPAEAEKMAAKLAATYENKINIVEVQMKKPMVKIVNVDINIEEEELLPTILQQNKDLRAFEEAAPQSFVFLRSYIIRTPKRSYRNVIIECSSIKAQKAMLRNGAIVMNFNSKKIFEYVDVLQCKNCYRFGHIGRG